jgi:GrpB-like predicted nucleotidyltransferase (UPF0157 family)/GNAT superfamily N-acetyltransferase
MRKIEVVAYSPLWITYYEQEANKITHLLQPYIHQIYHFGSTSIPDMPAKPVIDILVVIKTLDAILEIKALLLKLNYPDLNRHIIPHVSYFARRVEGSIAFHLHIREAGDPQINRHINFCNYLISHPSWARKYAQLKIESAKQFAKDSFSYVLAKDKLVQKIDHLAKVWDKRQKTFTKGCMGIAANNWTSDKIIKSMIANMNVHMTHFAQYLNAVELIRIPGYTLVNSNLPDDTFNYVLEADFNDDISASAQIKKIVNYFSANSIPFSWLLSPLEKPDNLSSLLLQHGFNKDEINVGMYLDLDMWQYPNDSDTTLKIVQINNEAQFYDFANVLFNNQQAFTTYFSWVAQIITEEDPIKFYVGYVNGQAVTRGIIVYFAQVAGIYYISTAPDARNKGYATVMENFLLKQAADHGYHIAVLQASREGLSLHKRLGFKECCIFQEFKLS